MMALSSGWQGVQWIPPGLALYLLLVEPGALLGRRDKKQKTG